MEEYNEDTCFTAGQLREMGFEISALIPDCGWIPKWALNFGEMKVEVSKDDDGANILHGVGQVTLTQPFQWVELDVTL